VNFVDEFCDPDLGRILASEIAETVEPGRHLKLMDICGGHTHSIYKYGVDDLLPENVELVHGPGCPVCVIPMGRVNDAIALAHTDGVIFTCFGDMIRVPGSRAPRPRAPTARVRRARIRTPPRRPRPTRPTRPPGPPQPPQPPGEAGRRGGSTPGRRFSRSRPTSRRGAGRRPSGPPGRPASGWSCSRAGSFRTGDCWRPPRSACAPAAWRSCSRGASRRTTGASPSARPRSRRPATATVGPPPDRAADATGGVPRGSPGGPPRGQLRDETGRRRGAAPGGKRETPGLLFPVQQVERVARWSDNGPVAGRDRRGARDADRARRRPPRIRGRGPLPDPPGTRSGARGHTPAMSHATVAGFLPDGFVERGEARAHSVTGKLAEITNR